MASVPLSNVPRPRSTQLSMAERKLGVIFDLLEAGKYKIASHRANTVLKKQPNLQLARALLALSEARRDHVEEANKELNTLSRETPTQGYILDLMGFTYRELKKPEKVCGLYERALSVNPNNVELLPSMFMAYVAIGSYKKQNEIARKLYKARQQDSYYFWDVMSTVLDASDSREKTAKMTSLSLAEMFMKKMEKQDKIDQEQQIRLYLRIMELQNKYKEALDILDSPLGRKLDAITSDKDFIPKQRLRYLTKLESWAKVNTLSYTLLEASPEQWDLYGLCHASIFNLIDNDKHDIDLERHLNLITLGDMEKFILRQQEAKPNNCGFLLATLDLECKKITRKHPGADHDKYLSLLTRYFKKFGDMDTCFTELTYSLPALPKAKHITFFEQAKATMPESELKSVDDINRRASIHKLRYYLGLHANLESEALEDLISQLVKDFERSQSLMKNLQPSEIKPADIFIILAALLLGQLWMQTSEDTYFYRGIALLDHAVMLGTTNPHVIHLLMKFCHKAAAVTASLRTCITELNHSQLDSLGHVMWPGNINSWFFSEVESFFVRTVEFFKRRIKETSEEIFSAYRYNNFTQIQELTDARNKFANSQHFCVSTFEKVLFDLLMNTLSHEQTVHEIDAHEFYPYEDLIKWEKLVDTRMFFAAPKTWSAPGSYNPDERFSESFVLEQAHLRFRVLIARSLVAAVHLSDCSKTAAESEENFRVLGILLEKLKKLQEHNEDQQTKYRNLSERRPDNLVQGPPRPRLQFYLENGHGDIFILLQDCVVAAYKLLSHANTFTEVFEKPLSQVPEAFKSLVTTMVNQIDAHHLVIEREEIFEQIFNTVESFGHACSLLGCCHSLLTPLHKGLGSKKSKKRLQSPDAQPLIKLFTLYNDSISSLKQEFDRLCSGLEKLKEVVMKDMDTVTAHKFSRMTIQDPEDPNVNIEFDDVQKNLLTSLKDSYNISFESMNSLTTNKKIYFSSLKFKI